MFEGIFVLKFVVVGLKVFTVFILLLHFLLAAVWLRGADNLAFPGLGLIVATPLLLILLAVVEIVAVFAAGVVSAVASQT